MTALRALTRAQWKGYFRDKQNLFWLFLFPLMFLFIFGAMFSSSTTPRPDILTVGSVAIFDKMPDQARTELNHALKINAAKDLDAARERVKTGKADGLVRMEGSTVILEASRADATSSAQLQSMIGSIVQEANLAIVNAPRTLHFQVDQVEDKSLKEIQYLAPGLLGWAVAMSACFGAGIQFVEWRRTKLLRRVRLSPAPISTLIASRTLVSIVVAYAQFVLFVGLAILVFDLKLTGSWWMAIPLMTCATLAFMAIGLVAGAFTRTAEAASSVCNLIILPMAFLSGSFFPTEIMPRALQLIAKVLPLGQLNEGLLDVMVRGLGPAEAVVPMLVLLGFAMVFGVLATRLFRWE